LGRAPGSTAVAEPASSSMHAEDFAQPVIRLVRAIAAIRSRNLFPMAILISWLRAKGAPRGRPTIQWFVNGHAGS
jgi:hypothetical protein